MDTSKVKNFILAVLVLVNIALFSMLMWDRVRSDALHRQEVSSVQSVFAENGVTVPDSVGFMDSELRPQAVARDQEAELKAVSAVLGTVSVSELGNRTYYQSAKGEAEFRSTGEFSILINEGVEPVGTDAVATARSFLRRMGIETKSNDEDVVDGVRQGSGTVILKCTYNKTEVINCKITLTFSNGGLSRVNGRRPLPATRAVTAEGEMLEYTTILMRFLELLESGGHVCSKIVEAELCYLQSDSASGAGTLTPVWRFLTDSDEFYLNGISGQQETIA